MISTLHEGLVSLFLFDPSLVVRLVRGIDGRVLTTTPNRLVDRHTAFYRDAQRVLRVLPRTMDLLLMLEDPAHPGGGTMIIVEVQLDDDPIKRRRIAAYLGLLVDRHDLPVHLGIVSLKDRVSRNLATWEIGSALKIQPYLFDRRSVPRVESVARGLLHPTDAILSGALHGHHGDLEVAVTALEVARQQPAQLRQRYTATVLAALSEANRQNILGAMPVEERMQVSQLERECGTFLAGRREGREEGQQLGERQGMQRLLAALFAKNGLVPDAGQWAQIEAAPAEQLEVWAGRVGSVPSVAELLAPSRG
ncbi:hypothetical protein G6O69_21300 [Pseudenhygromyxa sp. WMMC2535]|uniref:hypothetical protein n=1 Tax=Pseudenhygromyxa sp. WMMC2535 TaxID=2712867 RepID=UPI001554DEF3|nr:hypothetical protein [Pseudenhygromyxa sp. WMMC2535]NVB40390.1 hypothetical protein [Pseudenhygromyxa sp. WMMC2535]